jgi:hypothetical protein
MCFSFWKAPPDDLLSYLKEVSVKKPQLPDEKWEIKISPWSYDPRAYFLDVLTGSCYRPSLLRRRPSYAKATAGRDSPIRSAFGINFSSHNHLK